MYGIAGLAFVVVLASAPVPSPRALRKSWYREPARHSFRNESAEVLFAGAFIEQSVAYEGNQVMEFVGSEPDGVRQQWIDSLQDGLDRTKSVSQIVVDTDSPCVVSSRRLENIEMVADRVVQLKEGTIVEKCRLESDIAKRRGPEFIAVGGVAGNLLQPKIFVLMGSVKKDVAGSPPEEGRDLRRPNDVHLKVAKHLVGLAPHRVTLDASSFTEEDESAFLLTSGHRFAISSSEAVNRSICKNQSEFELSDGTAE